VMVRSVRRGYSESTALTETKKGLGNNNNQEKKIINND
jgi:hypothetical protein